MVALIKPRDDDIVLSLAQVFPGYVLAGCKGYLSMADRLDLGLDLSKKGGDSRPEAVKKAAGSLSNSVTS